MKKKYNVILVDAPWQYTNKRTGGTHRSGSAQKYETMSITEIQYLDTTTELSGMIAEDAVLFFWTTNSMVSYALMTLDLWDFEFKTMVTWVKKSYGLGYWFRGKTEHLLLGVRGRVKPFKSNLPNVIISGRVLPHSQKPVESYELIEQATKNMNPNPPQYLELFATRKRENWTVFGL